MLLYICCNLVKFSVSDARLPCFYYLDEDAVRVSEYSIHAANIWPSCSLCTDTAMRLEQRGLAASWSGLRFAFATGGDGESDMRVDLRNFAAFVRDPAALVTCLLLPHSCSVRLEMQVEFAIFIIAAIRGCVKALCLLLNCSKLEH